MNPPEKKIVFIHSDKLDENGYPDDCPFSSRRAGMTLSTIDSLGILAYSNVSIVEPEMLDESELLKFHTPEYLEVLKQSSFGEHNYKALKMGLGTPDCPIFKDMFNYSVLAAGGTVTGAQLLIDNKADIVFNASGGFHHAKPSAAAGFCYINDIVLGVKKLIDADKKVMVIDIDAHHFDGVQDAFYDTDKVTCISFHEDGKTLFPGTGDLPEIGDGAGLGFTVNVPLPVGTYDDVFKKAFMEIVLPKIEMDKPDVLVVELGMDGLAGDPLAHLNLSNNVYADITDTLNNLNIPMLITGGGGYNVNDTVRGWALSFGTLVEGKHDDLLIAGMGGVMLENTAWFGGLRDRTLVTHSGYRKDVDEKIEFAINFHKEHTLKKI
ncbi:MAG: acetoin utilization protein AcuC [Deltaproteobacteria bacterium]|nr:acetoin utilization protein AcuC [Deltaproteobacteria bacterium]